MKIKILLLSLFLANISIAQQKGIIYYGFVEALQRGNAKGTDYNAYMVFNKHQSYYVTAKDSLERIEKIHEQKIHQNKEDGGGSINLGMKSSPQGDQVAYHIQKNTIWSNFLDRRQFYLKEEAPKMNWKIEKETKKIGKFTCKKATVSFRGRNYTAWYSPEIVVPYGPWKLNGLPGLILEAYDSRKFVYWYFKTVEYPTKNKETVKYIGLPKKMAFNNYEDYKRFQKEQLDKSIDSQRIVQKEFPDVIFVAPKISEMFIEFE